METPPLSVGTKKNLPGSLGKSSLTPCRRPGLSRPSSSGLNKSCTNVVCTPKTAVQRAIAKNKSSESSSAQVDITPTPNCDERQKVPLQLSDALNVVCKVRRCLAVVSKPPVKVETRVESAYVEDDSRTRKKIKLSLEQTKGDSEVIQISDLDNSLSLVHKMDNHLVPTETLDEVDDLDEEVTPEAIEKLVKSIQEKKKKLEQLKVQETYAKKHNLEELRAQTDKWKKAGREALEYSVSLAKRAGYSVTTKQLMSQHSFPSRLMGYNSEDDEFE